MKKIALILVLLVYLIPAIGITVSAHYCGENITWVSVNFEQTTHKCACGTKKMKTDCCKDKTAFIKLKHEQRNSALQAFINAPWGLQLPVYFTNVYQAILLPKTTAIIGNNLPPPDLVNRRIYVRNCTYLI